MWVDIRTEHTFGAVYGPLDDIAEKLAKGGKAGGIADSNGTWGHVRWQKSCKKFNIKPIYGVRLPVVEDPALKERRQAFDMMTFIAMNNSGLRKIYQLVDTAHKQFYYKPLISYEQLNDLSAANVTVIAAFSPFVNLIRRKFFLSLSPATPKAIQSLNHIDYIATCDNWMINQTDTDVYEPFADDRKRERKTTSTHILTRKEWRELYPKELSALKSLKKVLKKAEATLKTASMVKYNRKADINALATQGAKEKGIDLNKKKYKKRFKREMSLIREKGYVDYFLVVADLIAYAKERMVVGHARGSSAGSLVCYLLGITEIDPLPYGLVFERFIDVNRLDLPDIDIDFQDNKRHLVLSYLQRQYGADKVAQIGNISRLKPKSALTRFAKALKIPVWEIDEVKDSIVERSGGDARAALCITDAFNESDVGRQFISVYPQMLPVSKIEDHASHTGVHAAGIIVCNEPITDYAGVNSRGNQRIAMIDKKDAEAVNLLKIDALGLRTLTILADVCDMIGMNYLDLYKVPLDDEKAFKVFKKQRLTGVFQFEGDAVRNLAKQMPVETIDDISALSALGRPGPLATGGASTFVKRRAGKEKVEYMSTNKYVLDQIKETFGVIIYQEQVLNIGRNYGGLSWSDVTDLRKAMSKSMGDEFFGKYKDKFIKGAMKKGENKKAATNVWNNMNSMGSWSFNKSHSVSYGMITYLCAYMKANHPLEFAVASLNHARDDKSAIKLLRDLWENEKIKYKAFSAKHSQEKWSIHKGKLLGGLLTLDGIGPVAARRVIKERASGITHPPGIQSKLTACDTPFLSIYPARDFYGEYYQKPHKFGISGRVEQIENLKSDGEYCVLGMLVKKVVRDANEAILVQKRGYKMDGPTTYINMTFEDDTESIMATIGRFD